MTPELALNYLQEACIRNANDEDAHFMAKYMKFNFPFFGLKTPKRREIFKEFHTIFKPERDGLLQLALLLWGKKERELHYLALDLLVKERKKLEVGDIEFIENLILQNSWWDSIDVLAPKIALSILDKDEESLEKITERWISDENMWLNRSAILLQLERKTRTNPDLLFRTILRKSDSREFFIQKACGWILREYYKTSPGAVLDFVESNLDKLKPLTIREGLKHHKY